MGSSRVEAKMKDSIFVSIETSRTLIRPLGIGDVSARYLSWLSDLTISRWIYAAETTQRLSDLQMYVENKVGRDDVLFLGVYDKVTGLHIGNIKYEPIVDSLRIAVMGVLIGDPDYRGKGVFSEIFLPTALWLHRHRKIASIYLGVEAGNELAIRAYEKAGFNRVQLSTSEIKMLGNVSMVYKFQNV